MSHVAAPCVWTELWHHQKAVQNIDTRRASYSNCSSCSVILILRFCDKTRHPLPSIWATRRITYWWSAERVAKALILCVIIFCADKVSILREPLSECLDLDLFIPPLGLGGVCEKWILLADWHWDWIILRVRDIWQGFHVLIEADRRATMYLGFSCPGQDIKIQYITWTGMGWDGIGEELIYYSSVFGSLFFELSSSSLSIISVHFTRYPNMDNAGEIFDWQFISNLVLLSCPNILLNFN